MTKEYDHMIGKVYKFEPSNPFDSPWYAKITEVRINKNGEAYVKYKISESGVIFRGDLSRSVDTFNGSYKEIPPLPKQQRRERDAMKMLVFGIALLGGMCIIGIVLNLMGV